MYRLLITCDEPEEQDRLGELIARRLPGVFQLLLHIDNDDMAIGCIEQRDADVWLVSCYDAERARMLRMIDPKCRMVYVNPGDASFNEDVLTALRRHVQDIDLARMKRSEQHADSSNAASLIPVTEHLLAILLMMETMQEAKFRQLTEVLGLTWCSGYAMMIAFPQIEGISPTENHMRLTRYYDTVNQFTKLLGPCVASPMLNRYMTVFFLAEEEQSLQGESALLRAERMYKLIDYLYGTNVTLGIGTLKPALELRQSYRQAAISAAYGEAHGTCVATLEDVQRSAARRNTEWLKRDTSIEFQLRPELGSMASALEQHFRDTFSKVVSPPPDSMQFG